MEVESWKFNKTISIPSIISTVGLIVIMILYVTAIEADVAVLQSQQEASEKKFDQIDEKLDQLISLAISDGRD
jgi:mannose/fructose/N-acetylgalactosamine-specific phosphotransferase system component IID